MQAGSKSIFRTEVNDAKRDQWLGTIELAMPISYRMLAFSTLLAILVLFFFLTLGRYTRHEQVYGELVPSSGLLSIAASSAGTVARTLVHEGDTVRQDQVLIELSTELESLTLGKTRESISTEMGSQRASEVDTVRYQQRLTEQKDAGLKARIKILRGQLQQIDGQISIQAKQVESAEALLKKYQPYVAKGVISGLQLEQQKSAALGAEAERALLRRQRADVEQQISILEDQLLQLPLTAEVERIDLRHKLAEIDQALAQNEGQRAVVLRAAQAGVVSSLMVKDGQSVVAGQRLLSVLPKGSKLQAEIWIASRAIGFVAVGDHVVLRYPAFPYQKFGQQFGEVAEISQSAPSAVELTALLGRKIEEPLYRVVVQLERQSIVVYGRVENLRPGMILDADVVLDSRSLIEWVFEPLFGFRRAMKA